MKRVIRSITGVVGAGVFVAAASLSVAVAPAGGATQTVAGVQVRDAVPVLFASGVESVPARTRADSISCPADGECVAIGLVATQPNGDVRYYVTVQHGGVWGDAQLVTIPAPNPIADVVVDCATPGECDFFGGTIDDATSAITAIHGRILGGVVQPAVALTIAPGFPATVDQAIPRAIACSAPGNCLVVGLARSFSAGEIPIEWVIAEGVAAVGTAIPIPPAVMDPALGGGSSDVECPAVGACVEIGRSFPTGGSSAVGWVRQQSNGTWGTAEQIRFPAGSIDTSLELAIRPVSAECWSAGECVIVGNAAAVARGGDWTPFAATISGGVVDTAQILAIDTSVTTIGEVFIDSIDCPAAGSCAMVATQYPGSGGPVGQRFQMSGGTWSAGAVLEAPAAGLGVSPMSVSCVSVGHCVIVAAASDGQNPGMATSWNYVQVGGAWQTPVKVAIVAGPAATDVMVLRSVRCVHGGYVCSAIGDVDRGGFTPASVESTGVAPEPAGVAPGPDGSHAVTQEIMFRAPEPIAPKYTG